MTIQFQDTRLSVSPWLSGHAPPLGRLKKSSEKSGSWALFRLLHGQPTPRYKGIGIHFFFEDFRPRWTTWCTRATSLRSLPGAGNTRFWLAVCGSRGQNSNFWLVQHSFQRGGDRQYVPHAGCHRALLHHPDVHRHLHLHQVGGAFNEYAVIEYNNNNGVY